MSVRLEWSTFETTGVSILPPGEEAYDGQYAEPGNWILMFGSQAVEGSLAEFEALLDQFGDALRRAPSLET